MTSFAPATLTPSEPVAIDAELRVFVDMLKYMRPAGSKSEKQFIKQFIRPLGAEPDADGNYWLVIPGLRGRSQVMWSCHTDTVHHFGGQQALDVANKMITSTSDCLGADCTTGVWIMRQMILAGVPGVYIFHRSEECGGLGSAAIVRRGDRRLDGIKFAIAFDRKGVDSVITHQMGQRCASEAFVASIAPMLPGAYKSDSGGTFTDTANYTHMIPECTNISVGYYDQHTSKESQDLGHAYDLAEAMKVFDETRLVAARDPSIVEVEWCYRAEPTRHAPNRVVYENSNDEWYDYPTEPRNLLDVVQDYPHEVADLLEQMGYDAGALMRGLGM